MPQESKLTIFFGGSCGFVPHADGSRVRVLLPQRGGGWTADNGNVVVPPHRAFMKFRLAAYDPSEAAPREPDFVYLDREDPVGVCFLKHETLTLPKSLDSSLFLNYAPIGNKATPTPGDFRSLDWAADADKFCQQAHVGREFLGPSLPISIAARVDIRAGVLESNLVPEDVFTLDPPSDLPGPPYAQCLAGMARATSRVEGLTATITSSGEDSLRLRAVDSEIKLEIYNEVMEDIVLSDKFHRPALYKDFDFDLLYDLTKAPAAHRHLPVNSTLKSNGSKSGTGGDCKHGFFPQAAFDYKPDRSTRRGKSIRRARRASSGKSRRAQGSGRGKSSGSQKRSSRRGSR